MVKVTNIEGILTVDPYFHGFIVVCHMESEKMNILPTFLFI